MNLTLYVRPENRIIFTKAKRKAIRQGLSLSTVVAQLLEEWLKAKKE